jgi:hypothetical protein
MDQIDEDEPDEESFYKGANGDGFDGVDGLLDQGFLSLAGRQQSTCTTPSASANAGLASIIFEEYDALEGGASGANLLMKMLKSEENGAELYDSLHRMLYGARAYRKDGMELEEEVARIADADAAGTVHHRLALFPIHAPSIRALDQTNNNTTQASSYSSTEGHTNPDSSTRPSATRYLIASPFFSCSREIALESQHPNLFHPCW